MTQRRPRSRVSFRVTPSASVKAMVSSCSIRRSEEVRRTRRILTEALSIVMVLSKYLYDINQSLLYFMTASIRSPRVR